MDRRDTLEQKITAPGQTAQPRVPAPGRQSPITLGYKNQWELWQHKKQPDFHHST